MTSLHLPGFVVVVVLVVVVVGFVAVVVVVDSVEYGWNKRTH